MFHDFFPSETFKGTTFENIITSSNVEQMVEGKKTYQGSDSWVAIPSQNTTP